MPSNIVTITSDFGLKDPYVAEMKAIILSLSPDVAIVDITHEIEKFNIKNGAFTLLSVVPYFPKGTIHLAVVDPGVGTARRAILIKTTEGFLVGPDNGLLILAAERQRIISVYEITNPQFMRSSVSRTFHGRDIFAPVAAYLANGVQANNFGQEIDDFVKLEITKVNVTESSIVAEVLHVDGYGNVITNVSENDIAPLHLGDYIGLKLSGCYLKMKFGKTYAEAKPKEAFALIGSHGFLELALNQGNAAETFQIKTGENVKLSFSIKK